MEQNIWKVDNQGADPGGPAVYGVGLKLFDSWDRGFEFRWGHGCTSLVFFV
jgi:hypothetical protein